MGSLKTRAHYISQKLTNDQVRHETLVTLVEAVSLLNDINSKLDKFGGIDKVIEQLDHIARFPPQQVVVPSPQIPAHPEAPLPASNEPAFIPTLNMDEMSVKGEAVTTKKKKRNLSGAAKNLKHTRSQDNG
jgi:hypothetical protein